MKYLILTLFLTSCTVTRTNYPTTFEGAERFADSVFNVSLKEGVYVLKN